MQLSVALILLASAGSTLVAAETLLVPGALLALPSLQVDPDWSLVRYEDVDNQTHLFFSTGDGPRDPASTMAKLRRQAACENKDPLCDDQNQAKTKLCDELIYNLASNDRIRIDTNKENAYCVLGDKTDGNPYCCVSWNRKIEQLKKGDVADVAKKIKETCGSGGVSGKIYGASVADTCLNVCVSNRGNDCG